MAMLARDGRRNLGREIASTNVARCCLVEVRTLGTWARHPSHAGCTHKRCTYDLPLQKQVLLSVSSSLRHLQSVYACTCFDA